MEVNQKLSEVEVCLYSIVVLLLKKEVNQVCGVEERKVEMRGEGDAAIS